MNIEKPTKQADTKKRLIFSFRELPEVKEALKERDEVRAAARKSLIEAPLEVQVEKLRDDIMKTLRMLNEDVSEEGRKQVSKPKSR